MLSRFDEASAARMISLLLILPDGMQGNERGNARIGADLSCNLGPHPSGIRHLPYKYS